jgi:hypothetical protein
MQLAADNSGAGVFEGNDIRVAQSSGGRSNPLPSGLIVSSTNPPRHVTAATVSTANTSLATASSHMRRISLVKPGL